jgi:hypothetical protein
MLSLKTILFALLLLSSDPLISAQESQMKQQPLNLQQLLDDTLAKGENKLTLSKGLYEIPSTIVLNKIKSFTIDGNGATLLIPPSGELMSLFHIDNITIKNLTVDCDPLPFTQGTITSISKDYREFKYEVHPGYPTLERFAKEFKVIGRNGIFVFNPENNHWRQDVPDLYPSDSTMITPTTGQFFFKHVFPGYRNIRVGDYVAFKNMRGNAFLFKGCGNITMEDVTVNTGPGAGFLMRTCYGEVVMRRCKIERGPKPVGDTHERLLSTVADGFNLAYSRQGVVMEDCEFSNMGDDSVNLHGTFMEIGAVENNKSIVIARQWSLEPTYQMQKGDLIRILDGKSFAMISEAKLVKMETIDPPSPLDEKLRKDWKIPAHGKIFYIRFELDREVKVEVGNKVEVPAIACPNFVFRNNYFHDHRARGLRIGASHGIIENNRFERIKSTPISLGPHAIHGEGGWVRDITVRNNTITESCFEESTINKGAAHAAAIVVQHFLHDKHVPYVQENRDIRIVNNTIDQIGGAAIVVTSADGVSIRENRISNTQMLNCDKVGTDIRLSNEAAININHSKNVITEKNHFGTKGTFNRMNTK